MEFQQKVAEGQGVASPPKRRGRFWKRFLAVVLFAALFFVFGFVPYFLVDRVVIKGFTLPDRENTEYVKTAFTVPREDITLTASDGVKVSGWWIPVEHPRGTVVLVHGLNRTRIEMAKKVEPLHAWGFNCILIDLRHHGASGNHPTTFGLTEKLDVRAAVDFALSKFDGPVVLWGVSLGGATATLEAADDPRVKGLISDSAYDSLPNTVRHHLNLARGFRIRGVPILKLVPTWPTANIVLFWMKERGDFDPEAVDVLAAAAKIGDRPSLFVNNSGDARIPHEIGTEMSRLAGPKSRTLLTDSKSHGGAWRDAHETYEAAVKKLLDEVAPPLEDEAASKVPTPAKDAVKPVSERTSK
ncbi:MAG: alpha/beta fold hydrolase [Vicinamibacteria bacterium]